MRSLGLCVGRVLAVAVAAAAGAGCHSGGTLTGAGGGGQLSGLGGRHAGGAGGASVILGGGGGGPLTGAAGFPWDGCGTVTQVDRVPPNIAIVLDTSASMNDSADGSCTGDCGVGSKWTAAISGIDAVVGSTGPSVNWGLEFIGGAGDNCTIGGAAVAVAPKSGASVMTALASRTAAGALAVTGSTPTRAALAAATDHLRALTLPGNRGILLLTDGQPACNMGAPDGLDFPSTIEQIAATRAAGVPTFVLGIGALDGPTDYALSMMAIQGGLPRTGTPSYYAVADAREVVTAMNDFVRAIGSCMFAIPPPPTNDGTTSRENIAVFVDGTPVPYDANDGWTYSDVTHTTVTFQGSSCAAVASGASQVVSVSFLCLL